MQISKNRKRYFTKKPFGKCLNLINSKSLLNFLEIELTERCNNNCIHCYVNKPANDSNAKKKEFSTDQLKKLFKEAVSLGCIDLKLTGGEPLLRKDFEELYIFARKLGLKVTIFTNASLITPRLAKLFSRIPPLENIAVTMYGMKKKTHEAITRARTFEATKRGIKNLLDNKVPFIVRTLIFPQNRNELHEFESFAKTIPWMSPDDMFYGMFFNLRRGCDSEEKNALIKRIRISPEEAIKIYKLNKERETKAARMLFLSCRRLKGTALFDCSAGKGNCSISGSGDLLMCHMLTDPETIYDLKKGCLEDALLNFFPKIRKKRAANPEYLKRCAVCFLKAICISCPANSWQQHGNLDTPVEYFCKATHTHARYFGILKKGEMAWEVKDWKKRIAEFIRKVAVKNNQKGENDNGKKCKPQCDL